MLAATTMYAAVDSYSAGSASVPFTDVIYGRIVDIAFGIYDGDTCLDLDFAASATQPRTYTCGISTSGGYYRAFGNEDVTAF